jgi:hypothetical protein
MTAALACLLASATTLVEAADTLPSWDDGKTRRSIVESVNRVTRRGGKNFVPPGEQITVFE